MKRILSITIFVYLVLMAQNSLAAVSSSEKEAIKNYVKAVKDNDYSSIKQAINVLERNIKTLKYMEEAHPEVYSSYQFNELLIRIRALQAQHAFRSEFIAEPVSGRSSSGKTLKNSDLDANGTRSYTNRDATRSYSLQRRLRRNDSSNSRVAYRNSNQRRSASTTRSVRRSQ